MSPRQIVAVALRVFAVWLVVQSLRSIPGLIAVLFSGESGVIYETFMYALSGAIALALWMFPSTIAGKLLPPPSSTEEVSPTADTWLAIGYALIGIWTLTSTIPRLIFDVLAIRSATVYADASPYHYRVVSDLVESAIAVWLLLGAKGLRRLFWWAQDVGTRKAP
jgi:hypothetical protein